MPLVRRFRRVRWRLQAAAAYRGGRAQLFSCIYRNKVWGGDDEDFYSGHGSHRPALLDSFVVAVRECLAGLPSPPVIVDIGCGDFVAGNRLVDLARHYHACDVVPELIERNRRLFAAPNLTFHVLDAVSADLPSGDVVIIKQVLQHLSNGEIAAIIERLSQYPLWIVAEQVPAGPFTANRDHRTGSETRLHQASGVVLTEAPFGIRPETSDTLSEVLENGSPIRTIAYRF